MKAKIVFIFTIFLIGITLLEPNTEVNAQNNKGPKYGNDSITCITNISLYREFYRQWKGSNYKGETLKDAIKSWRWVFVNCPAATQYTYVDGAKMLQHFIGKEEDADKREKFIDTLMMIYDKKITYFGNKGSNLGRKAVDYYQYRTNDYEGAYKLFKESISLTKNKSQGAIVIYYFRLTAKMVKEGAAEPSLVIDTYDEISKIIDYNLKKYAAKPKDLEGWQNVKGNVEAEFEPFATCEDLIAIYTKKFNENKDDLELLKKITSILDKKGCEEDQLFMDATIQLYKLEPSPDAAYLISRMYLSGVNKDYSKALIYLNEATSLTDAEKLAKIYYYIAMINSEAKKYSAARTNARKSLEYNPNNGQPYIMIGDMYAESAKNCGDNDLTSRVAYWAAVDQYIKAKRVDPESATVANKRINDYSKHFPTMETIFFYDLKEGDTYKVECWINETTTIRASK